VAKKSTIRDTLAWMRNIFNKFGFKRFLNSNEVGTRTQYFIDEMLERTESGQDVNGFQFAEYSKRYVEEKGSDHVNLRLTGDMLNDLDYRIAKNRIIIGFQSSREEEKADRHNYGDEATRLPQREFLGIADNEIDYFSESLADYIDEQFKT